MSIHDFPFSGAILKIKQIKFYEMMPSYSDVCFAKL